MRYEALRNKQWKHSNPDRVLKSRIRSAYRLLIKHGVIDDEKVLTDPTL